MKEQYTILRQSLKNAEREKVRNHKLAFFVYKAFIKGLQSDKNFKMLFCDKDNQLSEVYRTNLKLISSDFAFAIPLELPFNELVQIYPDEDNPGNVLINLAEVLEQKNYNVSLFLQRMVNEDMYLLQDKIQSWFEGRISSYMTKINHELIYADGSTLKLKLFKRGPAHTIQITSDDCQFSVGLIPFFLFNAEKSVANRKLISENWEAIPKPMRIRNNPSFRTSYIESENIILTNKQHLKHILRLMIKFRNTRPKMINLKSYHIKALFLWLNKNFDVGFWKRPIVDILRNVFNSLLLALESKEIKSIWDDGLNLLNEVVSSKIESMKDEVKAVTRLLMQPIVNLPAIFLTAEEQKIYCCSISCGNIVVDEIFQKLSAAINIDVDREKYTKLYDHVRNAIIKGLKTDYAFKLLFSDLKLAGSYADNLKISKPDEFDLIVRLKLPYNELVKILPDNENKGNVLINLTDIMYRLFIENGFEMHAFLQKMVNKRQFLLQNKIQSWLERLMSCYIRQINHQLVYDDGSKLHLKYSKQGPAHTIFVQCDGYRFSIDFVPGFQFEAKKHISNRKLNSLWWEAIPKPMGIRNNPSFRTSFADSERTIFMNKNQFKNALRLMKKFRDNNPKMVHLKSYFIKTLFLWHNETCDPCFWKKPIIDILRKMFNVVEMALKIGVIMFFWDEELNMLEKFTPSQIESMYHEVINARKRLDCASLIDIQSVFLTDEEITRWEYKTIPETTDKDEPMAEG